MKSKKIIALCVALAVILTGLGYIVVQAAVSIAGAPFKNGVCIANVLNIRSGIGTTFSIVGTLKKNDTVMVASRSGDWYIICTPGGEVGAVLGTYIKAQGSTYIPGAPATAKPSIPSSPGTPSTNTTLNADEQATLNAINAERAKAGLPALKIDAKLQNVARLKAQDLVNNNYFSHQSPTYGSPFDMMKSFGVTYNTAGENLAGNSSVSGAVSAWMNSPGHRANVLNANFNYTGVGVVPSPVYGKMFVLEFIGK